MTLMPSLDDPFFHILCVDDNSTMLQMLKLGFGAYGFEVVIHAVKVFK